MNKFVIVFHLIGYYICWFTCIMYASDGDPWTGTLIGLAITLIQCFLYNITTRKSLKPVFFIVCLTLLGTIVDGLLSYFSIIKFGAVPNNWPISTPWMITVWLNFSLILIACIPNWFKRYVLLAILALIGFPIAYSSGVYLGAATFIHGYQSSLIIGIVWMIILPTTTYIYSKVS